VLQEVFLRAWRRRPELVQESSDVERYWLYAVARNLSIDRYRRRAHTYGAFACSRGNSCGRSRAAGDGPRGQPASNGGPGCHRATPSLREPLVMRRDGRLSSTAISEVLGIGPVRSGTTSPWRGPGSLVPSTPAQLRGRNAERQAYRVDLLLRAWADQARLRPRD